MNSLDQEGERTQENVSFDVYQESILCIDIKGQLFGACYLDIQSGALDIYEDCQLNNPAVYIESIIDDLKPTTIFASTRVSPAVVSVLEELKEDFGYKLNLKIVADFTKLDTKRLIDGLYGVYGTTSKILSNCSLRSPNLKLVVCIRVEVNALEVILTSSRWEQSTRFGWVLPILLIIHATLFQNL